MGTAAAVAAFTIVPRHVLGGAGNVPPSEKLNIAGIGIGGRGEGDLDECRSENIVALCDVDENHAGRVFKKYPKAKKWTDFRKMLDEQKDIDAVVIATPDHLHAVVAMAAIKRGKHVYCEKPLAHCIWECRQLTLAAREAKVATQLGNQGQATESNRLVSEIIWDGARHGPRGTLVVQSAHLAARDRAAEGNATGAGDAELGSVARAAPSRGRITRPTLPFSWRGWWDFRHGRARRHRLSPARPGLPRTEAGLSDDRGGLLQQHG